MPKDSEIVENERDGTEPTLLEREENTITATISGPEKSAKQHCEIVAARQQRDWPDGDRSADGG